MPSTTAALHHLPGRVVSVSEASTVATLIGQHPFHSGSNFSSWFSVKPFHGSQIRGWNFTHSCSKSWHSASRCWYSQWEEPELCTEQRIRTMLTQRLSQSLLGNIPTATSLTVPPSMTFLEDFICLPASLCSLFRTQKLHGDWDFARYTVWHQKMLCFYIPKLDTSTNCCNDPPWDFKQS